MGHFGDFQQEIYTDTGEGLPITYDGMERAAERAMTAQAFAFVAGAAGTERTARANLSAFDRWRLVPRMLRDVSQRDLSTTLFGTPMAAPVLLAPVGLNSIVHDDAELAPAAAAASLGLVHVVSTCSTTPMEKIASAEPEGRRWFQLYWPRTDELAKSLVTRAERAGYEAIVLTVDTSAVSWRPRDLGYRNLPFHSGQGIGNYLTDPVFRAGLAEPPESSEDALRAAIAEWSRQFGNPTLTFADLARLKSWTNLPLVVKGICHAEDARAVVDAGADGIIVSNHGGRQVDGARAALDCLPDVVGALPSKIPVLFDSGIRCGADVMVALSLGASAVLVGRHWIYGLGVAGRQGVEHAMRCLLAEFDLMLALSGYADPAQLDRTSVVRES
ncbi:alpha-hydroxy-acid oxidizing protein [Allokutzneria sp. A3M-2-11 16]|uniref:alpha-hydroxy-acid oxidizing protein n=1 Tax=Allokutzneria sp. A3M-2-11 16 TaxID=2962043 RepID=UPI0020B74758|nr:alpha-hydroxy-acid oxidizing protein [Allokutzneria sp. A3M-2-11 16]MCP3799717.1 alpha-hydroxy-acid oxidizing protein [Allokutzneria sp. A3M-2-11 16]